MRSAYLRVACGVPTNPLHSELANKELGPQNVPNISCPIRTSLAADAYALNKLREYRKGSIVQWAWLTTGHVSEEEEYKHAWQEAAGILKGERFHAWFAIREDTDHADGKSIQLPHFVNTPLEDAFSSDPNRVLVVDLQEQKAMAPSKVAIKHSTNRFESEGAHGDPVDFNDLPPANPEDMDDWKEAPDEDPDTGLDESDEEADKYPGCVEGE
eukprot:s2323_g12.t1